MANELKAKLVIESEAQGSQEIIKLRGEVDKLGDSLSWPGSSWLKNSSIRPLPPYFRRQ